MDENKVDAINPSNNEENNKSNTFNLVIGIATLLIALLGATFAYFSATARSAENDVTVKSAYVSISYDGGTEIKASNLIPATETVALSKYMKTMNPYNPETDGDMILDYDQYNVGDIEKIFDQRGGKYLESYELFDIYEGEQIQLEIKDGPTIVTAAYDTILINDINSSIKATDIAIALSNKVFDLAKTYNTTSSFNKTIVDFNNGFSNAIISNNNSSTSLKIDKWCDYEGEQLQIKLNTGDVILSSSVMLDLINGGTSSLNASEISKMYISDSGKNIDNSNGNTSSETYNKYLLDLQQKFKYALKVVDGNVTIIPLKTWKDFYNTDGNDNKADSPNCEQIQLVLPDGTAIVTTAYDTLLVDNVSDINDIAELVRGENGVISDLTEYVGKPAVDGWNISLFDTKYYFEQAILSNGQTSQVFPIKNWLDFKEGEQLQINFNDNTGILTSFVNATLVSPATSNITEVIAKAFSGDLEQNKNLVKIYK